MSERQIVTIPDEVLRKKAEKVKFFDDELKALAQDLVDTVKIAEDPEGAGIAAPQISVSKRVIVVRNFFVDPINRDKYLFENYVLVNPKIISMSKETDVEWEGCLSVPDQYGEVERPSKIKVVAQDIDGKSIKMKASGYFARTIQHEIDHLDGILFTDKVIGKTITEKELDKIYEQE